MSLNERQPKCYSPIKGYLSPEQQEKRKERDQFILVESIREHRANKNEIHRRKNPSNLSRDEKIGAAKAIINRFRRGLLGNS